MHWQPINDKEMKTFLDPSDDERSVMRAIVKASFELARPAGLGHQHFDRARVMSDDDANLYINLPDGQNAPRTMTVEQSARNHELALRRRLRIVGPDLEGVMMDYVQGRLCKTALWRCEPGRFILMRSFFECQRGSVELMLSRANEILSGRITMNYTPSDAMFAGASLTIRAKEKGFDRQPGETDWLLRQRIFLVYHPRNPTVATEFLFGCALSDLPAYQRPAADELTHHRYSARDLLVMIDVLRVDPTQIRKVHTTELRN